MVIVVVIYGLVFVQERFVLFMGGVTRRNRYTRNHPITENEEV